MAARSEILSELKTKIASGNVSDAYRTFEELPVVDQIAVSIAPGIGDVLAAYEVKEFGSRAKTNIKDKDYLGAAGNTGLQVLSGISLIPLFRFLRGAKAVTKSGAKAVDVPQTPKEQLQLAPPKEPKVELPKVEPFVVSPAKTLDYDTSQPSLPLGSKVRKFLHGHYKKLDPDINELSINDWIKTLTNPNNEIPIGELRLLNVIDPYQVDEIHPKLAKFVYANLDIEGKGKISKQGLDSYIARQQRDALQIRGTPPGKLESPDVSFVNNDLKRSQQQKLYFVRGAGEQRTGKIHNKYIEMANPNAADNVQLLDNPAQRISGNKAYVFDGIGDFKPLEPGYQFTEVGGDKIAKALQDIGINETDNFASIFRIQSDLVNEMQSSVNGFVDPKAVKKLRSKLLQYNKYVDQINPTLATDPGTYKSLSPVKAVEDIRASGVNEFTIEPDDIQKFTGKPFTDSLDKTPEDIFYMIDKASPTLKQRYIDVPDNPIDLSKAYFKDFVQDDTPFFKLQNGARILKKAVMPKIDFENGYKVDPYFENTKTNEMKLPVRTNVLQAVKSGKEGIHIGSAQAVEEQAGKNIIEKYTRGEKEIQKILNELGLGNKKKTLTTRITGTDSKYDGTYLRFSDEFLKAVEEKGIDAFKDGGAVDIDKMLAEL